jgi:hypothetical protein
MFKRFQLFDLYFGSEETTVSEWVDPNKELPADNNGVFRVKLSDKSEVDAYYMVDRASHLCRYTATEPSYWWHRRTKHPIHNVTHWGKKAAPFTANKEE